MSRADRIADQILKGLCLTLGIFFLLISHNETDPNEGLVSFGLALFFITTMFLLNIEEKKQKKESEDGKDQYD